MDTQVVEKLSNNSFCKKTRWQIFTHNNSDSSKKGTISYRGRCGGMNAIGDEQQRQTLAGSVINGTAT